MSTASTKVSAVSDARPADGARWRTTTSVKASVGVSDAAGVVGENTPAEGNHEPQQAGEAGPNPAGGGGREECNVPELPEDEPLKLGAIKARFYANTKRCKECSKDRYWQYFKRFARDPGCDSRDPESWTYHRFERLTKNDLRGAKGKALLQDYHNNMPEFCRTTYLCGIRKVWRRGLDLRWPLDRDDTDRAPSPRFVPGPRRSDVSRWVEAARNEQDPYDHAWFMVELTYGLREPNQVGHLKRKHIEYNAVGEPIGFVVHGAEADFKKDSYLIAALPKDVAQAVGAWLKVHPSGEPDSWLFPHKDAHDRIGTNRQHNHHSIDAIRRRFARRWNLPWLTSKAMRKHVKATLIDAGMPRPERDYWQGHKPPRNDMDAVYGTKPWDEILAKQLSYLPGGPMGTYAKVRLTEEGVPAEVADLWRRFQANEIDAMDFADALKTLKRQANGPRGASGVMATP